MQLSSAQAGGWNILDLCQKEIQMDTPAQEAWNEKVLALCSEDFWLLFLYFRTLAHKMTWKRKSFIEGFLRYGNPDCQILGTLKNKIQIHGFLSFLSNDTRSNFIFRVVIYLLIEFKRYEVPKLLKKFLAYDPWAVRGGGDNLEPAFIVPASQTRSLLIARHKKPGMKKFSHCVPKTFDFCFFTLGP